MVPIPGDEVGDALFDRRRRLVVELLDEVGDVGVGIRNVARLQGQHFHIGLPTQGLLQRGDIVHEFDRTVVADVVDPPGGHAGARIGLCAVPGRIRRGRTIEHTNHAFDDVVDVGRIAPVPAVVEDRYLLAGEDGLGEFEQGHVGATPGAIDGEEAQAGGGQAIQMAVGVRHQFVAFLAGGVEAEGVVNVVMHRKGHRRVRPVHTGAAGVYQVFDTVVATAFQDMGKADDVAVDVGERVLDGVAHAGLSSKVDDTLRLVGDKALFHGFAIAQIDAQVGVVWVAGMACQPCLFDGRVVVVVVVVDANDGVATFK